MLSGRPSPLKSAAQDIDEKANNEHQLPIAAEGGFYVWWCTSKVGHSHIVQGAICQPT